jgi:Brp/Blh family beta-carotene 15,15'-monooxygenase
VTVSERAPAVGVRRLLVPVNALFGALIVVCALGPPIPEWLQYLPFALSLVLFGLPHGALDHLVPARLAGRRQTAASIARVVLLYLLVGVPVFALWSVAPAVAFVAFIALTWAHWGLGDLFTLLAVDGVRHLRARGLRMLAAIVRGALPMLVPLLVFPKTYEAVARQATAVFGAGTPGPGIPDSARVALAVAFAALVLGYAWLTRVEARRMRALPGWHRDIGEVLLLAAFFATVPPVLAVGLYFSLWHGLRHILRLGLIDGSSALSRGQVARALREFARDAAPVTAIALVILVALAAAFPPTQATGSGLGLYLVLISALTMPHALIVGYMDRRQGLWSAQRLSSSR